MSDERLWEKTRRFRQRVARLLRVLPRNDNGRAIGQELARSLADLGAHYRAALSANSAAERLAQFATAQEDADDTAYWMEVISGARLIRRDQLAPLLQDAADISATFATAARRPKTAQ